MSVRVQIAGLAIAGMKGTGAKTVMDGAQAVTGVDSRQLLVFGESHIVGRCLLPA